jgi:hypothetical protein
LFFFPFFCATFLGINAKLHTGKKYLYLKVPCLWSRKKPRYI